jgi:hypothetical protein
VLDPLGTVLKLLNLALFLSFLFVILLLHLLFSDLLLHLPELLPLFGRLVILFSFDQGFLGVLVRELGILEVHLSVDLVFSIFCCFQSCSDGFLGFDGSLEVLDSVLSDCLEVLGRLVLVVGFFHSVLGLIGPGTAGDRVRLL